MELCPGTDTLGYSEIFWTIRDLFRRAKSKDWTRGSGTIESHEFRAAGNHGWLAIYYSYEIDGQWRSGEFRKWLLISHSDREEIATKAHTLFPIDLRVPIRVHPKAADISVCVQRSIQKITGTMMDYQGSWLLVSGLHSWPTVNVGAILARTRAAAQSMA
jgi:hypothetical protein